MKDDPYAMQRDRQVTQHDRSEEARVRFTGAIIRCNSCGREFRTLTLGNILQHLRQNVDHVVTIENKAAYI